MPLCPSFAKGICGQWAEKWAFRGRDRGRQLDPGISLFSGPGVWDWLW